MKSLESGRKIFENTPLETRNFVISIFKNGIIGILNYLKKAFGRIFPKAFFISNVKIF
jgi:hypothetical protein